MTTDRTGAGAVKPGFTRYQAFVVAVLAFLQFTIILDFMIISPLGAIVMPELHITTRQFGLAVSVYAFSAAVSGILSSGFADRFEVYWRGVELANAFHELNDPAENEKRFAEDTRKKVVLGKPAVPRDEALVEAIRTGLPPSGGIALGLDRLFMSLVGPSDIASVRAFPIE